MAHALGERLQDVGCGDARRIRRDDGLHERRIGRRLGALREPLPCWSAFTEGHITYDGKLSACCFDAGDQWIMSDLNRASFMDGWNSPAFVQLREAHLRRDVSGTICESCVAYA